MIYKEKYKKQDFKERKVNKKEDLSMKKSIKEIKTINKNKYRGKNHI